MRLGGVGPRARPRLAQRCTADDGATLSLATSAVNDPPVIGPGFVHATVAHALAHGWDPQARGAAMALAHASGRFIEASRPTPDPS